MRYAFRRHEGASIARISSADATFGDARHAADRCWARRFCVLCVCLCMLVLRGTLCDASCCNTRRSSAQLGRLLGAAASTTSRMEMLLQREAVCPRGCAALLVLLAFGTATNTMELLARAVRRCGIVSAPNCILESSWKYPVHAHVEASNEALPGATARKRKSRVGGRGRLTVSRDREPVEATCGTGSLIGRIRRSTLRRSDPACMCYS